MGQEIGAANVHIHDRVKIFSRGVRGLAVAGQASRVKHDVKGTVGLHCPGGRSNISNVQLQHAGFPAACCHIPGNLLQRVGTARCKGYFCPVFGKGNGAGHTDAGRGAGDQSAFAA